MTDNDDRPIEDVLQDLAKKVPDEEWAKLDDGGPAFPLCRTEADGRNDCLHIGMSLRQYAAIELRVPDSDNPDWLDAMILESRRLDLAGHAWFAINPGCRSMEMVATRAFEMADAMLAEWRKNDDKKPQ